MDCATSRPTHLRDVRVDEACPSRLRPVSKLGDGGGTSKAPPGETDVMHHRPFAFAALFASVLLTRRADAADPVPAHTDEAPSTPDEPISAKPAAPAKDPSPVAPSSSYMPDIGSTGFMIYLTPISGLTYRP